MRIAPPHGCKECALGLLDHTISRIIRVEVARQRMRFVDPWGGEDVVHGLPGGVEDFFLRAGAMVFEVLFAPLGDLVIGLASLYGRSVSV